MIYCRKDIIMRFNIFWGSKSRIQDFIYDRKEMIINIFQDKTNTFAYKS